MKSFTLIRACQSSSKFTFLRSTSSSSESLEIPQWIKLSQKKNSFLEQPDDDFVIPSKIEVLTGQSASCRGFDRRSFKPKLTVADSNIEFLTKTLNSSRLASPDEVVHELEGFSVSVSDRLVSEMLRRFSNDWVSAYGFFKWVLQSQPCYQNSPETFDLMVDILGKSRQFDLMWSLIEQMGHLKIISLLTITKAMRRLAGARRWNDAIEAFHSIEKFGLKKDTPALNALLDALCKERSVMRARDIFFELREFVLPDATTFNILVHGWCKARKLEEARWTMEDMRSSGFNPCIISYTSLIEAHCMDKNFREVDSILEEMRSNGCTPNVITYTILMHSLGKANETQEALRIYDLMKRDSCAPDSLFYNSLIYILCRNGLLKDAVSVYEDMRGNGCPPDVTTYNTLISSACAHSQEEKSLSLLLKMEEDACQSDIKTYTSLLKYCCRMKRMKMLFFLLDDMVKKGVGLDYETYTLLVQRLCRNGKVHLSCSFFEKMVSKGFSPREQTVKMLLNELERKELTREKEAIVRLMEDAEKRNLCGGFRKNRTGECFEV